MLAINPCCLSSALLLHLTNCKLLTLHPPTESTLHYEILRQRVLTTLHLSSTSTTISVVAVNVHYI
jgi:hypothetical protein